MSFVFIPLFLSIKPKILIPILDSLLQKTDIVDYSKDTTIFLDIDQD